MRLKNTVFILLLLLLFSCANLNSHLFSDSQISARGINHATTKMDIGDAYNSFRSTLKKNEKITVVAELDHSQNAAGIGMDLAPTRIIFFGNPELGTVLMKDNQLAGLDLPLRVLFYKEQQQVIVLYSSISYLKDRYGLHENETLKKMDRALKEMIGQSLKVEVNKGAEVELETLQGIETIRSIRNFENTYNALKKSLETNDNIKILAEVDHRKNAAEVGKDLRPTRLILFGNPKLGTPLMQSSRSVGLDLPQKMLVWEDEDGKVNISYNEPSFLDYRHGLNFKTELEKIYQALKNLATNAAGL